MTYYRIKVIFIDYLNGCHKESFVKRIYASHKEASALANEMAYIGKLSDGSPKYECVALVIPQTGEPPMTPSALVVGGAA